MANKRSLLLLSNSTLHGHDYLEHASKYICDFLNSKSVKSVLFIPYALRKQDEYADTASKAFAQWGFNLESIHKSDNPKKSVQEAQSIFIGGGNTFQLLTALYKNDLIEEIKNRVLSDGIPYIGSSAGTNVATLSIKTTNDMPIVYPPSFDALSFVPFNINPHYIDTDNSSIHKGETREQRILQFHEIPNSPPVLALREGSILRVTENKATLMGDFKARLFIVGQQPKEYEPNSDMSFLL